MARRKNNRRKESAPGWVWMAFGLGLGLLVAIGVYLRVPAIPLPTAAAGVQRAAAVEPAPQAAPTASPAPKETAAPAAARPPPAESRFSFYEVLPELEVVIPDDTAPAARQARRTAPPAETPGSFLLQAGSFSAAGDADRLQANLALLGFESHVQRVTIDDGVFNRVRIGPIGDLEAAKRTQRRLRDAGVDTLLMKVPN